MILRAIEARRRRAKVKLGQSRGALAN